MRIVEATKANGTVQVVALVGGQLMTYNWGADVPVATVRRETALLCEDAVRRSLPGVSVPSLAIAGDGVRDDTAALQAWIDTSLDVDIPGGVYRTSAPLDIPANAHGLSIRGAGRLATVIEQHTDNVPIIRTRSDLLHNVTIDGLQLRYKNQQTDTASDAYGIQFNRSAALSGAGDHYHWVLSNLLIDKAYQAFGPKVVPGVTQPIWGCEFRNIMVTDPSHGGISFRAGKAFGQPNNRLDMIYISARNTTPTGYAIEGSAAELNMTAIDIEDWDNRVLYFVGGKAVNITGLHIERLAVTEPFARLIEVSNGSLHVNSFSLEGVKLQIPGAGQADVFIANVGAMLTVHDFDFSGTPALNDDTLALLRSSDARDVAFSGVGYHQSIVPWRPGSEAVTSKWDRAFVYDGARWIKGPVLP